MLKQTTLKKKHITDQQMYLLGILSSLHFEQQKNKIFFSFCLSVP